MPVNQGEETAPSGIFEKVAKDPAQSESTASSHEAHENEHTPGKPSVQDIQSKGPAIPQTMDDMPPKASKEELKARAKELNQE
ncbi:hypothetical protein MMC24_003872 [Lignoscripta atroalba]|nr:hypothetical protein [Lignoscripta atroalba]